MKGKDWKDGIKKREQSNKVDTFHRQTGRRMQEEPLNTGKGARICSVSRERKGKVGWVSKQHDGE